MSELASEESRDRSPKDLGSPRRVRRFVTYFKNYMGLSTMVAAALPIPVTTLSLIPEYAAQRKMLGVYASLFCFLTLASIFYSRHGLARLMFVRRGDDYDATRLGKVLPLMCIVASLSALVFYQTVFHQSTTIARAQLTALSAIEPGNATVRVTEARRILQLIGQSTFWSLFYVAHESKSYLLNTAMRQPHLNDVLSVMDEDEIPFASALMFSCLGLFVFAEAAFVLMALREYLQDLLEIADIELLRMRSAA